MATNISLVTYAGQTVTPLDDALIYEKAITNGIIDGCECALSGGNTIHMEGGHGVICGRKFTVYESDTNIALSSSGTLYGRMKVHLDLSDTGEPISFIVETAALLPALTQDDDVNVSNGIYEFAMCTFTVSETTVSDFAQVFPTAYAAERSLASMDAQAAPLSSTDLILIERADGTKKSMTYTELINAISNQVINRTYNSAALENYLKNNGTTTASGYALDAKYGKTLKDALDELDTSVSEILDYNTGAGFHNSIYRGKNLGTSWTAAMAKAVSDGTFDDMYIGDYVTINSRVYRIAGFDLMYRCGDNVSLGHNVCFVPDAQMGTAAMNSTNITTGGYVSSEMRTTNLASAKATIQADFGSYLMSYRDILTNAVDSNGQASGWEWKDCDVELMSETMVYGTKVWGNSGYEVGCLHEQLPLFRLSPMHINTRYTYWLRSVRSAAHFALVTSSGFANANGASSALGIRPLFFVS